MSASAQQHTQDQFGARVVKVDDSLGLVFGYAIVCKVDGEPYYDLQGDHIPESVMLSAVAEFMASPDRVAKEMHDGDAIGQILMMWPMTEEIAKALDIEVQATGALVAMKPSESVLKRFQSGELTGFSIGGDGWYAPSES